MDLSLTPSPPDPAAAVFSRAEYTVKFTGAWTIAATPDGVPSSAHFSRLVGGVHNGDVVFLTDTTAASPGVESMAEEGDTTLLKAEIKAAGDDRLSVLEGTKVTIGPTASESLTAVALTTDHPRVTLVTMVAPTPDWFVGVSGLSMLDSLGGWRASRTGVPGAGAFDDIGTGPEAPSGFGARPTTGHGDPPEYDRRSTRRQGHEFGGRTDLRPQRHGCHPRRSRIWRSAPAAPGGPTRRRTTTATPDWWPSGSGSTGADPAAAPSRCTSDGGDRDRTAALPGTAWTDIPDSAAGGANVSGFTVGVA